MQGFVLQFVMHIPSGREVRHSCKPFQLQDAYLKSSLRTSLRNFSYSNTFWDTNSLSCCSVVAILENNRKHGFPHFLQSAWQKFLCAFILLRT